MQMTLTLDACARCGQPILSGQPVKQTATVDFIDGRVVASPAPLLPPQGRLPRRRRREVQPRCLIDRRRDPPEADDTKAPPVSFTGGAFAFPNSIEANPTQGEPP